MWSTCRSLQHLVIDVIKNGQESRLLELEVSLFKHKDLFLFPLKPLGKDSSHREAVKKSAKEPISLPYVQQKVALSQDFIDEVLVLSDLFEANELLMVELLLTAESQLPSYRDYSRGLLAVSLYLESHLAIIDTLRTIILSREGRAWSSSLSEGSIEVIRKFTSDLWDCGFLYNVIGTLKSFDAAKEFSRLERAQALGASKHRHDVYQLLRNIQNTLSECVLLWSCQSALSISEFRLVLDCFLHSEVPREDNAHETQQETSMKSPIPISHSRAHLLMSLLYTLDPFPLFAISPEQLSELSEEDLSHPLYSDRTFACTIGQLLDDEKNSLEALADPDSSDRAAVVALLRLTWAICLRRTVHLRHELSRRQQNQLTRSPTTSPTPGGSDNRNLVDNSYGVDEDEELQAAMGIEAGALEFIRKRLLQVVGFDREVLWFCRVHSLITDLVVHMPNRVKEIRLRDENLLRRTGFDPASTGSGFANFLLLIAELYNQPGSRLHARFSLEYWWPSGELAVMGMTTGGTLTGFQGAEFFPGLRGFPTRSPSKAVTLQNRNSETDNIRQASLFRFIRSAGDMVTTPCLFLPYIQMLHGLVGCRNAAGLCFSLLKANVNNPGRGAFLTSWDHFFGSFRQYLDHMKQPLSQTVSNPAYRTTSPTVGNQLYPHLYRGSVQLHLGGGRTFGASADPQTLSTAVAGFSAPSAWAGNHMSAISLREIQPEEQQGLQAVLRLISRIARMDPVARSLFASTTHWQVIPTCIGLLSCPISLGLKADLLHLLTALSRSSTIGTLIWRHITMSELFPVSLQRTTQQPLTPCGLNTEMDEVEPRVEEYPVTRAFLALTTVLMPQLIEVSRDVGGGGGGGGGVGSSNNIGVTGPVGRSLGPDTKDTTLPTSEESALLQSTSLVATIKFLTNSVFLKHNMRAYRDPNERWDIAAACLVLFDGCVEQFLTRLDSAAAVVLNTLPNSKTTPNLPLTDRQGPGSRFSDATHSFDWASALLTGVCEMENEPPATQSRLRSQTHSSLSSMATLLSQLRLPPGWPYSDPGFYLSTQLLSDSAVFRTLTGLLEVGLHRILEYPLPDGPPVGMVHATAAGLQLIRRLLAQEETLHTFLRRTTNNPSFSVLRVHTHTLALPGPSGLNSTVLPTCLSRLLLSINARTGRADLLSTLLRFGVFAEELPDHCAHMMDILRSLVTRIRPHSDLLAVLTADESSRRELLGIFAGLIKWTTQCDVNELATESGGDDRVVASARCQHPIDVDCFASFTDEWLLYGCELNESTELANLFTGSTQFAHPAAQTARLCIGLPCYPAQWEFPSHDWELWATWHNTPASVMTPVVHPGSMLSHFYTPGKFDAASNGNWLYTSLTNGNPVSLCTGLLHILLAALDYPAPNLAHWLLGFRIESGQAVARTTLQDAGIGDQPRTCLHAMLEIVDTAMRSDCFTGHGTAEPTRFTLTVHWNLSLIWQILYRLSANQLSSESLLRFLRSNHDLLAKHVQLNLISSFPEIQVNSKPDNQAVLATERLSRRTLLELLSLNRISWMLRILAIEIRDAATGNHRSYALKLLKLFWGELLITEEVEHFPQAKSNAIALLHRLKLSNRVNSPDAFDLRALDAWVVDELITDCELGCPILQSESMAARKASSLIDPVIIFNRLYAKLLVTRLTSCGPGSMDETANLFAWAAKQRVSDGVPTQLPEFCCSTGTGSDREQFVLLAQDLALLRRWIESRNNYRLILGAGKQAALEGWRQVVEISLGLLVSPAGGALMHALTQSTNSTMLMSMTSDLSGALGGLDSVRLTGPTATASVRPRAPQLICLDVMSKLLSELCKTNHTPSSLCLLASGSCLNLASFACIEFPFYQKSGLHTRGTDQLIMDMGRFSSALIPAVRLLTLSIMRTKSSNQRMRANFYGSLSFLLRFAQSLTRAAGAMDDANQPFRQTSAECLSAITQAANTDDESHWSLSDTFSGGTDTVADGMAMLSLLCWDLSRGHTVAQMAAMTVLELLIAMDRSSTELITFLCSQGTLQCLVDTIPTDLSALETFLLSASQITTAEDFGAIGQSVSTLGAESAAAATPIFHMYRAKMSLLCRTATTLTGAKRIAQTNLLQSLSNCAIFSAFTVASCYIQGVDSLLFGTDESLFYPNGTDRKASGEALAAWNRALLLLSSISRDETPTDESSVLQYVVRLIAAIDPEDTSLTNENEITWSTVLLPAVRLFKSLLVTLGSTHVSVTRQAVDFLYTHSDALLAAENVPLSSILFTFLNRRGYAPNLIPVGARWLAEWIAAETSVVELFALVLRSTDHVATNVDEYCALQREVVQSRATRYALGLISNLIGSDTDSGKGLGITRFQFSSEVDFSQFVCETQQMYLMQCSTSVLIAVLGQSVSVTGDSGTMLSLNLSKSSRLPWSVLTLFSANATSEEDSSAILQLDNKLSSIQPGVHLIVSTLSWALRHIGRVEKICLNLANLGFFKTSATRPDSDETPSKTKYASRDSSLSGQMVLCLLQHDSCNWDLSTENLRQVVNSMFSIPSSALSSSSEPSVLGIDGHQREMVHLQNLISFGLASLRAQLRSLITVCEQSAYCAWRLLDHYLNHRDDLEDTASTAATNPVQSPRSSTALRRLQDDVAPSPHHFRGRGGNSAVFPNRTPGAVESRKSTVKREVTALKEYLPRVLDADLFEAVARLSKSSYLEPNQRLFVQVMQHRLERFVARPAVVA